MKRFSNIAVILPAFNEAANIGRVIGELEKSFERIIVIDDGSSDATAEEARRAGARALEQGSNKGKGAALYRGFLEALKDQTLEAAIVMDADGQHSPEDAVMLAALWQKEGCDLIIGERDFYSPAMPRPRAFWNTFISKLFSLAVGRKILDSQCGLRLYSREFVSKVLPESKGYVADSEMLSSAILAGADVRRVTIHTIYMNSAAFEPLKDASRAGAILFFISKLFLKNRLGYHRLAFVLALAAFWFLIFRLIAFDIGTAKNRYLNPNTAGEGYVSAMKYLSDHSPKDAIVLSEWTQGHQIVALAGRRTVATTKVYPSEADILAERFRDIGKFFFALSPDEANDVIDKYGVSYVFMRKKNFDFYLCEYRSRCGDRRALVYKLLAGESVPFLATIYETDWYKILKVSDGRPAAAHYAGFGTGYEYFLAELKRASEKVSGAQKSIAGGIIPHHYPFTEAFFPEFFAYIKKTNPSVVVLIGPDHNNRGKSAATFSARAWLTPFGALDADIDIIRYLQSRFGETNEKIHQEEWSLSAIIPYVKAAVPEAKVVPILTRSDFDLDLARELGEELRRILPDDAVIILSADFAHRLSKEKTEEADRMSQRVIDSFNIAAAPALEVDARTALVTFLAAMSAESGVKPRLLDYATSQSLNEKNPKLFPPHPYIVSYFSYVFEKQ